MMIDLDSVPCIHKTFFVLARYSKHDLRKREGLLPFRVKFSATIRVPETWDGYDADAYEAMGKLMPAFKKRMDDVNKKMCAALDAATVRYGDNDVHYTVFCCHSKWSPGLGGTAKFLAGMSEEELEKFLIDAAITPAHTPAGYRIEQDSEPNADGTTTVSSYCPGKGFTSYIRNKLWV